MSVAPAPTLIVVAGLEPHSGPGGGVERPETSVSVPGASAAAGFEFGLQWTWTMAKKRPRTQSAYLGRRPSVSPSSRDVDDSIEEFQPFIKLRGDAMRGYQSGLVRCQIDSRGAQRDGMPCVFVEGSWECSERADMTDMSGRDSANQGDPGSTGHAPISEHTEAGEARCDL